MLCLIYIVRQPIFVLYSDGYCVLANETMYVLRIINRCSSAYNRNAKKNISSYLSSCSSHADGVSFSYLPLPLSIPHHTFIYSTCLLIFYLIIFIHFFYGQYPFPSFFFTVISSIFSTISSLFFSRYVPKSCQSIFSYLPGYVRYF